MAIGDKLQLTAQGSLYGVSTYNVFNYVETGEHVSLSSEEALAEAFNANVVPLWMDSVSEDFTLHCLTTIKEGAGPAAPFTLPLVANNVGTQAAPALPASRVVVMSLYSATISQRGRGSKHFSGIPSESETDNCITNALLQAYTQFATDALTGELAGNGGFSADHAVKSIAAAAWYTVVYAYPFTQVRQLRGRQARLC